MTAYEVLYRKLLGDFSFTAKLKSPRKISIGQETKILPYVLINASSGEVRIGPRCYIDRNVLLSCNGGNIIIGEHCSLNPFCVIYGHGGLQIGNDVRIATGTVIIPGNHGFKDRNKLICDHHISAKGIVIGNDCWIGANTTILDGVNIGDGCVIGAGSVVTKSIEPYTVAVGNPARIINHRE